MLDLTKPLQTRSGLPATILHKFYNGVQEMMVVSLNRGPTCSMADAKDVEVIKTYDTRWGKVDGNPSMTPADPWDLMEVPPPDTIRYLVMTKEKAYTRNTPANMEDWAGYPVIGQIKVVVDGRTNKIKSAEIL